MTEPLVVVEDLHKSFMHMGRELEVLRGIDLTIERGDIVAIVGQSGAGKSTLLHCIGTLDLPTRGRIRLGATDLTGLSGAKLAAIRNRTIGFVFQFHHLLPEFDALENVMMPGLIQGKSRSEMEAPARTLLEEVGLSKRGSHRPGELSGGEQQRVALARALVLSPKLLLADEPTGNLDSATSDAIHRLFFDINEKHGTTVAVVTHNAAFAQSMRRVVTMRDGKIHQDLRTGVQGQTPLTEELMSPEELSPKGELDTPPDDNPPDDTPPDDPDGDATDEAQASSL
jgi:lipoprotein-releasing system ATP-binding protein